MKLSVSELGVTRDPSFYSKNTANALAPVFFPLPMWMTLLDFVCLFIGGGPLIGVSMLYTMLADVVHVDDM